MPETRSAGKMARNQRSVTVAAMKDILQGIRKAEPASRPAGKVAELNIFNLNVVMEKTRASRKPALVENVSAVDVFAIGTIKQISSKMSDCQPVWLDRVQNLHLLFVKEAII